LVLYWETRSCHGCRHNDLEGHSNFSSTIYSFSILCLEHHYCGDQQWRLQYLKVKSAKCLCLLPLVLILILVLRIWSCLHHWMMTTMTMMMTSRYLFITAEWSTADGAQVLYGYVKDQPVWNSVRFWTAAYFDLLHQERASAAGFEALYFIRCSV